MNEHELKSALRGVMVASSPPPPIDPQAALSRARRVRRRRQTTWGGLVAGLAVVGIAVGAALVPDLTGGGSARVGGQPSDPARSAVAEPPPVTPTGPPPSGVSVSAPPDGATTKGPWPDGQTDRTATSGPRADRSVGVLADLGSSLPAGIRAVDKPPVEGSDFHGGLRYAQARFADHAGDLQVWEYTAATPVQRAGDGGVGKLWIQVETRGNSRLEDLSGCGMAVGTPYPVQAGGRCDVVVVDGREVAVVTGEGSGDVPGGGMDQAAFHRHADGTLVIVAQSQEYAGGGYPALTGLPLTPRQLAALAADPEFHLD